MCSTAACIDTMTPRAPEAFAASPENMAWSYAERRSGFTFPVSPLMAFLNASSHESPSPGSSPVHLL